MFVTSPEPNVCGCVGDDRPQYIECIRGLLFCGSICVCHAHRRLPREFFLFLRKSIAFTQVRVTFHPKRNAAISQTELFTWQRQIKNTDTVIQSSCSMEHWSKQLAVVTSYKKKKETKVYEWAIKPLIYVYNGENIVWICTGDRSFSRRIGCKVRYHYTASRVFH